MLKKIVHPTIVSASKLLNVFQWKAVLEVCNKIL